MIRLAAIWTIPGLLVWIVYVVLAWGVFLSLDACARWWAGGGDIALSRCGWIERRGAGRLVGIWWSSRVAFRHGAGLERESRARDATRMGSSVPLVLDVLAGSDRRGDFDPLVVGPTFWSIWPSEKLQALRNVL